MAVVSVQNLATVQLAPSQIMVARDIEFDDALRTPDIERHVGVVAHFAKPIAGETGAAPAA